MDAPLEDGGFQAEFHSMGFRPELNNGGGGYRPVFDVGFGCLRPELNNGDRGYRPEFNVGFRGFLPELNNGGGGYHPDLELLLGGFWPGFHDGGSLPPEFHDRGLFRPKFHGGGGFPQSFMLVVIAPQFNRMELRYVKSLPPPPSFLSMRDLA